MAPLRGCVLPVPNRRGSRRLLSSNALKLQPKQQEQPKNAHEMPVVRGCIQGAPSQDRFMELMYDPNQPTEAAQHMYRVHGGEDVKERAVWISSQIQPLRPQLQPGRILGDHKEQTERQRYV